MNCPACGHLLTEKKIADLRAAACEGGCGGVWFDRLEAQGVRKEDEPAFLELCYIRRRRGLSLNPLTPRICPGCQKGPLQRVVFGPGSRAMVCECPACGGCWLEEGELAQVHFEWQQSRNAGGDDDAAAAGLVQYLYELRTGHRKT